MLRADEITALVAALRPHIIGGQAQKIREPDPRTVVIRVRTPGCTTHLVLSCAAGVSRIAEAERADTLPEPTTLGRWLRATLKGRRILDLRQVSGDRVVELVFEGGRLVCELTGRHANLFGVDDTGRVVATARRASEGTRDLRPGKKYIGLAGEGRPVPTGAMRFTEPKAVEAAAQTKLGATAETQEVVARARLLKRARKQLGALEKRVRADVARAADAETYRVEGELLKAHLYLLKRGMEAVEVTDWFAEGGPMRTVALNPKLDGPENVTARFARYKKAKAGAGRAAERLVEVLAAQVRVEALAAEALSVEDLEAALKEAALLRGLGRRGTVAGRRRHKPPPRLPYRVWLSSAGERILVGRGGADNHATTFGTARGNDHWLHVRDVPGAHVIVPQPVRGQAPKSETLRDAAALAAHHSDLKGEPRVMVTHTQRKHVRAVKGGPPGRVTIAGAKTMMADDVEGRLKAMRRVEP